MFHPVFFTGSLGSVELFPLLLLLPANWMVESTLNYPVSSFARREPTPATQSAADDSMDTCTLAKQY